MMGDTIIFLIRLRIKRTGLLLRILTKPSFQKKISIRYKKSLQKEKENPLSEKFIRRKISLRVKLFVVNVVIK